MGDGGLGFLRRNFNPQSTGGTIAVPGVTGAPAPAPSQSLLAGPAAPGTAGVARNPTDVYSLQGVYFNKGQFSSVADCLTAASAQRLPLDVCR